MVRRDLPFGPARQRMKGKDEGPEVTGSRFHPGQKRKLVCWILRGQRGQAQTGSCQASGARVQFFYSQCNGELSVLSWEGA